MFRALTAAALCALVCACGVGGSEGDSPGPVYSTPAPSTTPRPTSDFAASLLALHNRARAARDVAPLQWSPDLAVAAAPWARTVAGDGRLRHSDQSSRPNQGENIWMGTAGFFTLDHIMDDFLGEESEFRPGTFPDVSSTGNWRDVAHYTQIIWPGTTRVGCAMATAHDRDVLVCRYSPPGNVFGQPIG